ncbi:hypothetical protein [Mesorhizobium sp.]|uniref:hypothetical protein n=1 Tax=Mesorhizobium sp. TaxID=1871066 RepID=UPI000FE595DF|nr:hypothetical protein [Mesorhizobium sp.]RWB55074.1 MAG: hypothetical protein EOQ47_16720 [Mesorhizobium sp.]TKB22065.1 MAG: hypothetical protein E5V75_01165 [Mesorhizobium sp.]
MGKSMAGRLRSQMRIGLALGLPCPQCRQPCQPGLVCGEQHVSTWPEDEAGMWPTALLAFLVGVFGANGVPHFVSGITGGSYPCVFGNSAIPNVIAGWASFVVATLFAYQIDSANHPVVTLVSGFIGALLMGLFHAAGLAFGRKP